MAILAVLVCFVLGCILWNDYQSEAAEVAYWRLIQDMNGKEVT